MMFTTNKQCAQPWIFAREPAAERERTRERGPEDRRGVVDLPAAREHEDRGGIEQYVIRSQAGGVKDLFTWQRP